MKGSKPQTFAVIIGLALSVTLGRSQTPPVGPIGIVDHVSGAWTRPQDGKDLIRGDFIFAGQTVAIEHTTKSSISIIMLATGQLWKKVCSSDDPCEGSYRPPAALTEQVGFWAFLTRYRHSDPAPPPILAGSRSTASAELRHALVIVSAGKIDLAPALIDIPPGTLSLTLIPEKDWSSSISLQASDIQLTWNPPTTSMPAPSAGLYALRASDGKSIKSTAALLVVDPSAGGDQIATWQNALKMTTSWQNVDRETIADLLLDTLRCLAQ